MLGALGAATAALGLCLLAIGCDDKKPPPPVDAGMPDADTGPIVGGRLGQALASAAQAPTAAPQTAGPAGPPENGIMDAEAASKAHAPGAPPKLEVLGEGSEPRATLAYDLPTGSERKARLILSTRVMQQGLPPISLDVTLKPEKAKGDDKKKADDKAAAPPAGTVVVGKIGDAKALQGELQEDLKKKMKDIQLRYRLTPNGVMTDLAIELPKDPGPALQIISNALKDALSVMIAPLPDKPVGVGGYWMVTDRARSSGADVIRYRVMKVEKLDGKNATLSIEARQYATNPTFSLAPITPPDGLPLDGYAAQGKGKIELGAPPFLPAGGTIELVTQAINKSQRMMLQTGTNVSIDSAP
jgi:hypothetical protein